MIGDFDVLWKGGGLFKKERNSHLYQIDISNFWEPAGLVLASFGGFFDQLGPLDISVGSLNFPVMDFLNFL